MRGEAGEDEERGAPVRWASPLTPHLLQLTTGGEPLVPYVPPARLDFWLSRLPYVSGAYMSYAAGTPDPVTGQGGYYLDGGEHYDPWLGFSNARDLSIANDLEVTDWSASLAAAEHNYRDLAVRATSDVYLSGPSAGTPNEETPGVPPWHVFLAGIARHYLETGSTDAADLEAADILMSSAYYPDDASFRENFFHIGVQRELALALWAMCERLTMGLGEHPRTDTACELALGHLAMWSAPPETRRFGIWCKLFMAALTCRAVTRYLELFGDSADATKVAHCAAIPAALTAFGDWVWTDGWIAIGVDPEGWNRGSIRYMQPAHADPSLDPIAGLAVVAVGADARRNFTGPPSLSSLDDHYAGAIFEVAGIADQYNIVAYDGATRGITLGAYSPGRDITTSDTFSILTNPVNRDLTEGNGASPDLNPMIFPLYAWLYRYYTLTAPDADLAAAARARAHAVFDGAYQSWNDPYAQKQWNQNQLWTADGLAWLEEADTFAAGDRVLLISPAAGGVLLIQRGGA